MDGVIRYCERHQTVRPGSRPREKLIFSLSIRECACYPTTKKQDYKLCEFVVITEACSVMVERSFVARHRPPATAKNGGDSRLAVPAADCCVANRRTFRCRASGIPTKTVLAGASLGTKGRILFMT